MCISAYYHGGPIPIEILNLISHSRKTDDINKNCEEIDMEKENPNRRFLQCPGSVTVHHLKKFIMTKYSLDQSFLVDVIYKEDLLPEDHTLIDVAYSYNWRKVSYWNPWQKQISNWIISDQSNEILLQNISEDKSTDTEAEKEED